jgi:DNA adenine methylase
MRYLGGKYRIADKLAPVIADYLEDKSVYWEPFLGAGWVAYELAKELERRSMLDTIKLYASDIEPNLMALHEALKAGSVTLPAHLSREKWQALKLESSPSALRAFAGYGCSFGGMFFKSYAKSDDKRNYAANAKHSIEKVARKVSLFNLSTRDFNDPGLLDYALLEALHTGNAVIYCDIPYNNTAGYQIKFNRQAFIERCKILASAGNTVLVSEYMITDD